MERIRDATRASPRRPASEPAPDEWRQHHDIRRLQQTAGNRAVAGLLLRRRAARAVLQRYDTDEHLQFGAEDTTVTVAGVTMTQGEMIAMADFFADVDEMEAHPQQVADVLRAIRSGRASTEEWQEATGGRYLELALDNEAHFGAPDAPAAGARRRRNQPLRAFRRGAHAGAVVFRERRSRGRAGAQQLCRALPDRRVRGRSRRE
jgi:hypothetical protein